jgi:hypothetical protein
MMVFEVSFSEAVPLFDDFEPVMLWHDAKSKISDNVVSNFSVVGVAVFINMFFVS